MFNKGSEVNYAYTREDVIKALSEAIPMVPGMKLHSCDDTSGHIVAKTGMSMFSYGENISIDVKKGADCTVVSIGSGAKTGLLFGGAADFGKNQKNIDLILSRTSEILKQKYTEIEPETNATGNDAEGKLAQLKSMLDKNLISQEEYENKRKTIIDSL